MRRPLQALAAATTVLAAAVLAAPAQAITHGSPDGDDHPYVGLMVATGPSGLPLWKCSGALVSPDLFVTAGHCTDGAAGAQLWFDSGPVEVEDGYPADGGDAPAGERSGIPVTNPAYDDRDFTARDLGVVRLTTPLGLDRYAELGEAGALDGLRPSVRTTFTAVGYGLTRASTPQAGRESDPRVRMTAEPRLLKIDHRRTGEGSFLVSANARTGGTCSGDSGGPVLLPGTDVIAGVVSYGKNALCGGQSGIYRLDRGDDLAWLDRMAALADTGS